MKRFLLVSMIFMTARPAFCAEPLTLAAYLGEVNASQAALAGARKAGEAANLLQAERELEVAPRLFGEASALADDSPQFDPATQGDSTKLVSVKAGLALKTRHGIESKVYSSVGKGSVTGIASGDVSKWLASQNAEVSVSLWRNWKGRETDSSIGSAQARRAAEMQESRFAAVSLLIQAEQAYWQLAAIKESMEITSANLVRARKLADWSRKRVASGLADSSELLQALAAVKLREQDLLDESVLLRQAAVKFNACRGVNYAEPPALLESVDGVVSPPVPGERADVRAKALYAQAAKLSAAGSEETIKPALEAYAQVSLKGMEDSASAALGGALSTNGTAVTSGVRFVMPLFSSLTAKSRKGYALEAEAAALKYEQARLDGAAEFTALADHFALQKRKLELARELEKIQWDKYQAETKLREKGKTTVYFIIAFENDFASAQLRRLEAALELRLLAAKLKLYGGKNI